MTVFDWLSHPVNWAYLVLALILVYSSIRVVTAQNVIRAALFLVGASAAMAGMFLLLSAEFVALALILVYIGAVIVLFLFGVMITRAPMGRDVALDHPRKAVPALVSVILFGVPSWGSIQAFAVTEIEDVGEPTSTFCWAIASGRFVFR